MRNIRSLLLALGYQLVLWTALIAVVSGALPARAQTEAGLPAGEAVATGTIPDMGGCSNHPCAFQFARTPPILNPSGCDLATAVADFTGDGIPDVLAATGNGISVYPGNGDGSFQTAIFTSTTFTFSCNSAFGGAATGDFNNDGKQDLVLATGTGFSSGPLLLFLGNGNGTFGPALTVAYAGIFPTVGDFNRDGNLDLVFFDGSSNLVVALGNGAGGFGQPLAIPVSSVGGIVVGRIDGDQELDIAVTNPSSDMISIFLGNGDGTFGPPAMMNAGLSPGPIALRDLNGDVKADLAVADSASEDVAVFLGNGDGTFQPPVAYTVPGGSNSSLVIGDFNERAVPDIAIVGYVLVGNGDGTFQLPPVPYPLIYPANFGTSFSLATADLNSDHVSDLVIGFSPPGSSAEYISILLGKGHGGCSQMPPACFHGAPDISPGASPTSVAVADLNGDGNPDFVTANQNSSSLSVALGSGHGSFKTPTTVPLSFMPSPVVTGDFNGDGIVDLVVGCQPFCTDSLAILLGDGMGGFGAPLFLNYTYGAYAIAVGDVNNDGKLDLVVVGLSLTSNSTVYTLLGNGDGTFQAPISVANAGGGQSLALGDFNGDGKLDLALTLFTGPYLEVLLGNGDGSFQPPTQYFVANGAFFVAVADFNGDKKLDIAISNGLSVNGGVSIFLGNGNGTLQPEQFYPTPLGAGGLVSADFNLDGNKDIALLSSNSVSLLSGNGDGSFQPAQVFAVDAGPTALALGHLDSLHNKKPGLVVTNGCFNGVCSNMVSVLTNTTP